LSKLDKSLSDLLALEAAGDEGRRELQSLQQSLMVNPEDAGLQERAQARQAEQMRLGERLSDIREEFVNQTLLSEDISEKDAEKLLTGYRNAFGPAQPLIGNYRFMEGSLSDSLRHLDECQKEQLAGEVNISSSMGNKIDSCIAYARSDAGFDAGVFASMAGVLGFMIYGLGLAPLGARYGREIEDEEYTRRREKEKKARDRKNGIETEEVNLKVKMQRPKR
jgi:hypothetical protein